MGFKRFTPEERIQSYKDRNQNLYSYKETDGNINGTGIITITCRLHGNFEITSKEHYHRKGCPTCKLEKQQAINKEREAQNDKVFANNLSTIILKLCTWDNIIWTVHNKNIDISCSEHGFITNWRVNNAVHRMPVHTICKKCKTATLIKEQLSSIATSLPEKSSKGYNFTYEVPTKPTKPIRWVTTICSAHGSYEALLSNKLKGKADCPTCAGITIVPKERFLKRAIKIHNDAFDYSKTNYVTYLAPTVIKCKKHGLFKTTPSNHCHTRAGGCPKCTATTGFQDNKPGILYYLSINDGEAYKIGITNHSVKSRYSKDKLIKSLKTVKEWHFDIGSNARKLESEILKKYAKYAYEGPNLLSTGNTELFYLDIMSL